MGKRLRYSAEFKAKVAKEAIKGEENVGPVGLSIRCASDTDLSLKAASAGGAFGHFSGKAGPQQAHEKEIKELQAKIGQLTVERDFLASAFGNR